MNEQLQNLFNLTGKVALVTGGSHGIGMTIGEVLPKAGAKLCINGTSSEKLKKSKVEFSKAGIDVFTIAFDVSDEVSVDKGISRIEREVGPVDVLVNNAGIIKRIPIMEISADDFRQIIDIDLIGPLLVSKRVIHGMIEKRSGKIIS